MSVVSSSIAGILEFIKRLMVHAMAEDTYSNESKEAFKKFFKQFREVTKNPYEYLSIQPKRAEKIKSLIQELYAWNIHEDGTERNPEILPEIILEGMDDEQIWQQIELRNNIVWSKFLEEASKFMSLNDYYFTVHLKENMSENISEGSDGENESVISDDEYFAEDVEDMSDDLEGDINSKEKKKPKKHKKSVVDDKFFKLSEMEEFLNAEDEKEIRRNKKGDLGENDVDYFNEDLSDREEENAAYRDFFADDLDGERQEQEHLANDNSENESTKEKSDYDGETNEEEFEESDEEANEEEVESNEDGSIVEQEFEESLENGDMSGGNSENEFAEEMTDEKNDGIKSSFELRQERLKKRIEEYEEKALSEKSWQLKGEIVASGRPQNSLLEEVLEFESTTRPAPVITEETTQRLEDIIKQRIKDKAWDDVERKVKPIQTPQEFRKKLILDQEKSKESLAQIYEKEYQKELEKLDPNKDESEEEPKQHKEIKELMKSLFNKLDALSNFHYTPKPVAPEPRIITNTPAVNMEEVAPVAVSDAKLLAPEEIKEHAKGDSIGKSERTRTDKNRERRKKKIKQRAIHKAQEERMLEKQKQGIKLSTKEEKNKMLKAVMKNKNVQKVKNSSDGSSLKSSKTFFAQLQDKMSMKEGKKNKKPPIESISAKRLKL